MLPSTLNTLLPQTITVLFKKKTCMRQLCFYVSKESFLKPFKNSSASLWESSWEGGWHAWWHCCRNEVAFLEFQRNQIALFHHCNAIFESNQNHCFARFVTCNIPPTWCSSFSKGLNMGLCIPNLVSASLASPSCGLHTLASALGDCISLSASIRLVQLLS